MLFKYLDLIDIFIDHFCRTHEQKDLLCCVKELLLCFDINQWAKLNPRQRISWVSMHLPQQFHRPKKKTA